MKYEKKILEWIDRNFMVFICIVGTLLSILVRFVFLDVASSDYRAFLEGWYNEIKSGGGINSLSKQVGEYNVFYQFCIAVMTYLPIRPLYAYKIFSVIFDYGLALIVSRIVILISPDNHNHNALVAYFAVLFSPIVILNSSAWAQCDAIYVLFAVCALYLFLKEKYLMGLVLLGVSFSVKLQAVFILPFFLFAYFILRKFSIVSFMIVPVTMIATGIPALFYGRKFLDIFRIYLAQTDLYKQVALNYPSFWTIFFDAGCTEFYSIHKPAAMIFTVIVLALLMVWWIKNDISPSVKNMTGMAFILSYSCVLFLPQMHERYSYLYEILAIIMLFIEKETWKLIIPLYILAFMTYGRYLFNLSYGVNVYSGIVNTLVWVGYVAVIMKGMYVRSIREEG